jgi:hypothetical protein
LNHVPKPTRVISDYTGFLLCSDLRTFLSSQVTVGHHGNPSYSGGRDQDDSSLKPAQANS